MKDFSVTVQTTIEFNGDWFEDPMTIEEIRKYIESNYDVCFFASTEGEDAEDNVCEFEITDITMEE